MIPPEIVPLIAVVFPDNFLHYKPSDALSILASIASLIAFFRDHKKAIPLLLGVCAVALYILPRFSKAQSSSTDNGSDPPPITQAVEIRNFSVDPPTIREGEAVKVSWEVTGDASTVSLGPLVGAVEPKGMRTLVIPTNTTLILEASGSGGNARKEVPVHVLNTQIEFTVSPPTIYEGGQASLQWKTNADMVEILGVNGGPFPPEGTLPVGPTSPQVYTYTIRAVGPGGEKTQNRSLTVLPPKSRPVVAVLGVDSSLGIVRYPSQVGPMVASQLSEFFQDKYRNKYDLLEVAPDYRVAREYLSSAQQSDDPTRPDAICYVIATEYASPPKVGTRRLVETGSWVDMTAQATVRLVDVENGALIAQGTAVKTKTEFIYRETPAGVRASAYSPAVHEVETIRLALSDALKNFHPK
jgi:hypothetical protein